MKRIPLLRASVHRRIALVAILMIHSLAVMWRNWMFSDHEPESIRWRQSQADNVREAVFRWQINAHRNSNQVCFLTVKDQSAGAAGFLARFRASPYVKLLPSAQMGLPASPMLISKPKSNGYTDAFTGMSALHFWIERLDWVSDERGNVIGGGASAVLSGDGGTFIVVRINNRWVVSDYRAEMRF